MWYILVHDSSPQIPINYNKETRNQMNTIHLLESKPIEFECKQCRKKGAQCTIDLIRCVVVCMQLPERLVRKLSLFKVRALNWRI